MDRPARHGTAPHAGSAPVECCTELHCESGLKNNYFEGKRLTPDMFSVEQRYLVERRRLLNRAIHGWGVVYGYSIRAHPPNHSRLEPVRRELKIGPGLALDQCGRELVQIGTLSLELDKLLVLDEEGRRLAPEEAFSESEPAGYKRGHKHGDDAPEVCWLLSVHYAEQSTSPVTVNDSCRCDRHEWDNICETVRYSLRRIDCADCCDAFECELDCKCGSGRCCGGHSATDGEEGRPEVCKPHRRGGCNCLCEYVTGREPGAECGLLCEVKEPCGRVRVDLRHGVRLACVNLVRDDCDDWTFGTQIEPCGPRRLVKGNDLLFDLIRGCDLTHISEVGWKDWHRREEPVPFEDFSEALGQEGDRELEYATRDFWVRFSRPVREATLRPDCFAITVMSVEREGGWWQTLRVPIVRLDTTIIPPEPGDPAGHVRGARAVVDGAWVEDGVRGRRSLFLGGEARVELEVRGDLIADCNGQMVDANTAGLCAFPTGNGAPGGTLLSSFRVAAAREAPARPVQHERGVSP